MSHPLKPILDGRETVDPNLVPRRVLFTGAPMPAIGLGTFGSDHVGAEQVAEAVKAAAAIGYRHFDCASVYGNESRIGESFRQIMAGGIGRRRRVDAIRLHDLTLHSIPPDEFAVEAYPDVYRNH